MVRVAVCGRERGREGLGRAADETGEIVARGVEPTLGGAGVDSADADDADDDAAAALELICWASVRV